MAVILRRSVPRRRSYGKAAALLAMEHGLIPPTINTTERDPEIELGVLVSQPVERSARTVLVPTLDPSGNSSCLVLQRV